MDIFISASPGISSFTPFSPEHFISLAVIVLAGATLLLFAGRLKHENEMRRFELILAVFILTLEIAEHLWRLTTGSWSLSGNLPLQLCRISAFVTVVMLVTRNYRLFEILYFWSIGGALNALITPTLSRYGFPHFMCLKFFTAHALLIFAVLYMIVVYRYRPFPGSIPRVLIITHLYAVPVAFVNYLTGGNYLYLSGNPAGSTLLGFFGEWPYYLFPLWLLVVCVFFILYIPWFIFDRRGVSCRNTEARE